MISGGNGLKVEPFIYNILISTFLVLSGVNLRTLPNVDVIEALTSSTHDMTLLQYTVSS